MTNLPFIQQLKELYGSVMGPYTSTSYPGPVGVGKTTSFEVPMTPGPIERNPDREIPFPKPESPLIEKVLEALKRKREVPMQVPMKYMLPTPTTPEVMEMAYAPQEPKVQQPTTQPATDSSSAWKAYGRPEKNPYWDLMVEVFGNKADTYDKILRWGTPDNQGYGVNYGGENLSYDPNIIGPTGDRGLFQTVEGTFNSMKAKHPDLFKEWGLNRFEDLADVRKNLLFTKLLGEEQGMVWIGAANNYNQYASEVPNRPNAPYKWRQAL